MSCRSKNYKESRKNIICSIETRKKISEGVKTSFDKNNSRKKISNTLKTKYKNKEIDLSNRGQNWKNKISLTKKNKTPNEKALIIKKHNNTCLKKYGMKNSPCVWKGKTKETSDILQRISKSVSRTMKDNPKLQFNYRLAQIRKEGRKFGGEARFEWCLKQAGYTEGIDYVYNKAVKVFDNIKRNKTRYFYPDFLLFGVKFIEIDGVCHDSSESKIKDELRTRILERNGYRLGCRISHDKITKNKKYMHDIIDYLVELKKFYSTKKYTIKQSLCVEV